MPPTLGNGKICYIEMPAADIARSADFYGRVFGFNPADDLPEVRIENLPKPLP